jgi:hypothetical protein
MLMDEALTAGQRNSLATGNSLMRNKNSSTLVTTIFSLAIYDQWLTVSLANE